MGTEIWTLRCQSCDGEFDVELPAGQRVIETAQTHPCPHCRKQPDQDAAGTEALAVWHHVVGFQPRKN